MSDKQHTFFVAGVQHHDLASVLAEIEEGNELELVPEPTNKYDSNAVKIIYFSSEGNEVMIGYVPKKISAEVSAWLEIGECSCVVTKLDKAAPPWNQCEVCIELLGEEVEEDDDDALADYEADQEYDDRKDNED